MGRSWTFGRKLALGFSLSLLWLLAVGMAGYRTMGALIENDHRVAHTHIVLEELAQLLSSMKDAETGQRGFTLTGEDAYLEPNTMALKALPTSTTRLRSLTSDNPIQQKRLDDVATLSAARLATIQRVIEARRARGADAALGLIRSGEGNKAMDELRDVIAAMDREERALLTQRRDLAEASASRAKTLIVAVVLLALTSVAFAAFIITRALNRDLGASVSNLRTCSAELEAAAKQQAIGTREQSSATTEVSTTITELLSTSRQIAESAQRVARLAGESAEAARGGDQTVQRSHTAIVGIKRQVEQIVGSMLDLGKKSQQAGVILDLVNELAEQTNILAINATIEAVGAGDSGRRFGVVADEIRKLADRVGGSTKEIRKLIDDIREAVNATVMATESGTKLVDAGARQFTDVTASFKEIAALVVTTTEAAREIELSTKQQTSAVEQVNAAITSVAQAVQEMEASSNQTLQTATELTGMSRGLSRLIDAGAAAGG